MTSARDAGRDASVAAALCLTLAGCATASPPPPETWDGLARQPGAAVDGLYLRPGAALSAYRSFTVEPPAIAFDRNWHPSRDISPYSNPLSPTEVEGFKQAIATAFTGLFADELAARGCPRADPPDAGTLHVIPGLSNVYLNTPPGTMLTWKQYEGRMTLVMDLRDGTTGQLLARIVDHAIGDFGAQESPATVANSVDFRRAVQAWARAVPGDYCARAE